MSTANSRPTRTSTDPQSCCTFVKGLFGPGTPSAPVFGSAAAIDELTLAIQDDGLFIQRQGAPVPADNIKIAYQHLQQKGVFPQTEQLRSLQDLTPRDGLALGIDAEDYLLDPANAVTGIPPFKTLDVDRVLGALRIVAKYYNEYTTYSLEDPQTHAYQLGIITMTFILEDGPVFRAQLYPSQRDVPATGTLWLYRWCAADDAGSYKEQWRALGNGTFDMATLADFAPVFAAPSVTSTNRKRAYGALEDADAGLLPPEPDTAQPRVIKRQRHSLTTTSVSDEQLFQQSPEKITGATILRLAAQFSNTELFERINDGLAAKNLPLVRTCNVITRRITLAIQSKAAQDKDLTAEEVRKELNEAREKNGVKIRKNVKAQETKEANRVAGKGAKSGVLDNEEV
ncbi:hypothetical protein LTR36_007324 [Oleoguttula mirabilis]|uniref:Uncharacterized protein n=1 Tax=Oleoguttula mirabilis TaxID=1507867 RepID=A0AAV9J9L2_9PEZI|nr:hypothetical protein LTR36_007324 [Oleoguttula mirabilis]